MESHSQPVEIGANKTEGNYFQGKVAEAGIWDTELNTAQVAALAKGYAPSLIQPSNLMDYWPIIGRQSPEPNMMNASSATPTNSPTNFAHPPMIYPARPQSIFVPAAAGGGSSILINAGSVSYAAQAFNVNAAEFLSVVKGAVSYIGQAVTPNEQVKELVANGTITYTPQPVNINAGTRITPAAGQVTYSGQTVTPISQVTEVIAAAAISYVGQAVTLVTSTIVQVAAATVRYIGMAIDFTGATRAAHVFSSVSKKITRKVTRRMP